MTKKFTDEELRKMMEEIITERQELKIFFKVAKQPRVWLPLIILFLLTNFLFSSNQLTHFLSQYLVNWFLK